MTRYALALLVCLAAAACSWTRPDGAESGPSGNIIDLHEGGVVLRPPHGGRPEVVRLRPRAWGAVDFSPDGERVAYDSELGIVVADADGANAELVRGQPPTRASLSVDPAWSPDGKRIVFSNDERLYTIAAAGGDLRLLGRGSEPDWSSAGDWIVFVRDWDANRAFGRVSAIRPDGTGLRTLARGSRPAISPDGNEVAYSASDPALGGAIYVVALDGGRPRLVVRNGFGPGCSPDARYLAFAR